jgi:hypothetical protein
VAFDNHENDDLKPYVYRTDNYGKTWHSINSGLPDEPVLVVREDPHQHGFLVLGNMTGLWFSRDNGAHWNKFQSGFPTAPVFDVKFVRHDLVVATHGRGVYVMRNMRPFEEMNSKIAMRNFHLFAPSVGTEFLPESGHAARPVMVDYYLQDALSATSTERSNDHTPVKIVIRGPEGRVISTKYGPAKAGVNEFAWAMRYPGPTKLASSQSSGFAGLRGSQEPFVLPGTYKVSVTAGNGTHTTKVKITGDPNLDIPANVQRANLRFALKASNNTSAFNEMLNRISDMKKVLARVQRVYKDGSKPEDRNLVTEAKSLDKTLTALRSSVASKTGGFSFSSGPLLQADLGRIGTTGGFGGRSATVAPTPQIRASAKAVWGKLDSTLAKFNKMLSEDVVNYNKAALAIGAPTLRTGSPIKVQPVQM